LTLKEEAVTNTNMSNIKESEEENKFENFDEEEMEKKIPVTINEESGSQIQE